ncbi:MAG: cytochrome C oxidase Cbb3 [Sandaracinus sp.]
MAGSSARIARFLLRPHDLRPRLDETMPALPLTDAEARDLAAFLAPSAIDDVLAIDVAATYGAVTREADDVTTAPIDVLAIDGAAIARGRAHAERLGCPSCHAFGALWPAPAQGPRAAPDLAFARERLVPSALVRFLLDPSARSPGTVMPRVLTDVATARELAAFLLRAPLPELLNTAPATAPSFERLPLLDRPVMFDEVEARVLRRSCWHCHSDASLTYGDGGPGNTGGLGFAPREIDLSSYTHLMAGALDREGQRGSLFREVEGAPLLLRALLARHDEERGVIDPEVRGMPLGLPPLDAEQIQLVESWIAQGRPR